MEPDLASAISAEAVRLLRLHTGRGPAMVTTPIAPDSVTVILEDVLTTTERRWNTRPDAK